MALSQHTPGHRRDGRYERLFAAATFYRGATILLLVIVAVEAGVIIWQSRHARFARAILIDGKVAVFVRNEKAAEEVHQRLLQNHKANLPGRAFLEQKWASDNWPLDQNDEVLGVDEALLALKPKVTIKVTAAAIQLADQQLAVLPTKESAQMALDLLKKEFSTGEGRLKEARFLQEDVQIAEVKAQPGAIIADVHEAVEMLRQPLNGHGEYTVQAGDSWYVIAEQHEMTKQELKDLNPEEAKRREIDLRIGTVLKVSSPLPPLTVITVWQDTREEVIKPERQEIKSSTMLRGKEKETFAGTPGRRAITEKVTYRNGKEFARETIEDKVLKEPVPKRVMVGTASPPSTRESGSGGSSSPAPARSDRPADSNRRSEKPSPTRTAAAPAAAVVEASEQTGGRRDAEVVEVPEPPTPRCFTAT